MNNITYKIYTTKDISSREISSKFFTKAEELGLSPEYISYSEPINKPYGKAEAISLWTQEREGCYDFDLKKMVGKVGGMLARNRSKSITYMYDWCKWPNKKSVNYLSFYLSTKSYNDNADKLMTLFRYVIELFDAFHANITLSDVFTRQHETGNVEQRLTGVFWCNYFSNIYVNHFGRKKLLNYPWFNTEETLNGIFTYLDENPISNIATDSTLEEKAKRYLGCKSFARCNGLPTVTNGKYNVPNILK